ncbi:MAG: hypothetical protein K0R26_21 [Bacteroidota bacterium]|jgi:hypothetical protein|nr:hypothetical protein [Bacteroidota bacterium]
MTFFEELKGLIIPIDKAKTLFNFNLELDESKSKALTKYKISTGDRVVTIFINKLTPKETATLKKVIKIFFNEDAVVLINELKASLLEKLYNYDNSEDKQTLEFFKPILSIPDYNALRDSLFLRTEFKGGGNINGLKTDIIVRYGERGNSICNVCSAGYFEQVMIPLFNSSDNHREFHEYYDITIDRGLTAFFVNGRMDLKHIEGEIERRITSAKSYGLGFFHVHGIGAKNITNIDKCLKTIKSKNKLSFTEKRIFKNIGQKVYVVELII